MSQYYNLLNQAGQIGSNPYQAYGGELTAGINQQQMQGIGNINANAGFAQPYIQQAAQYANQAASPISAAQIEQYESPYTQQVVNATQNQFNTQNAQQQSQVTGNAAAQGALGGDRSAVAQALTAGQQQMAQAPVIAGLENQGYQSGLSTALQEQQNMGQAAYSLGNLGVAGQNAALTGANAQVGAGSLEQQTQQQQDQALMNAFYQQEFAPEAMLSWQAGIDTGVGSQMGGQSTTTGPPPNALAQMLGLGVAGLGAYGKMGSARGGRIAGFARPHYAGGGGLGSVSQYFANPYIPQVQITHGSGPPKPPNAPSQQSSSSGLGNIGNLASAGSGLGSLGSSALSSLGDAFPEAGAALADALPFLALRRGGGVHGYDDGGGVDDLEGGFDPDSDAFSPNIGMDAPYGFGETSGNGVVPPDVAPVKDTGALEDADRPQ